MTHRAPEARSEPPAREANLRRALYVAVLAALIAALAALGDRTLRVSTTERAPSRASASLPPSLCPPGTLPDEGVCIPAPAPGRSPALNAPEDVIPKRPDRPAEYARYVLPVTGVASIAELGDRTQPDGGPAPSGIGIETAPGTAVGTVSLDGQDGPARVLYAGPLWGPTVITLHTTREGGITQQYVVLLAGLGALSPHAAGDTLAAGTQVGTAGTAELVLGTRLLLPNVDPRVLSARSLLSRSASVATDPRNVLLTRP